MKVVQSEVAQPPEAQEGGSVEEENGLRLRGKESFTNQMRSETQKGKGAGGWRMIMS